ncbi:MAG: 3'-5' exonuclease [Kofleriaceae bacterium]
MSAASTASPVQGQLSFDAAPPRDRPAPKRHGSTGAAEGRAAAEGRGRRKPAAAAAEPFSLPVAEPAVAVAAEVVVAATPQVTAVVAEVAAVVTAAPAPSLDADGLLVFDVETTGTDKRRDQVIELCVQFGLGRDGQPAPSRTWRFRPQVEISPGAQAVHGISMEDLAGCPAFGDCADEIAAMFAEAKVLVGYNLAFDIDMIQAEFERLRRPPIDFGGKTIVDPFRLWQQCEPRSLQHAHQRFVGETFAAAHSAEADVAATGRVLLGMLGSFGLEGKDWGAVADVCDPTRASWVGSSRHLQWDAAGDVVFGFGKHAGKSLHQLAREDASYLRWLMDKDFPLHVGELCRAALEHKLGDEFRAWARQRFGGPAEPAPVVTAEQAAARGPSEG